MRSRSIMGSFLAALLLLPVLTGARAQEMKTIKLNDPNQKRGLPFMETLSVRASATEWSDKELSMQDLSDLLWAANGINRPEIKKRTAFSAMNTQDVDIYLFMKDDVHVSDALGQALIPVVAGDLRSQIGMRSPGGPDGPGGPPGPKPEGAPMPPPGGPPGPGPGGQPSPAPIQLVLVSDVSRFRAGAPELKYEWAAIDTGIVSQNISLFCAATGMATRPRASIDKDRIKKLLKLNDTQHPFLNHPIGYPR